MRRKYYSKNDFKNLNTKQIKEILEEEVFTNEDFLKHVDEVVQLTDLERDLVLRILKSYFTNILIVINSIRKFKTKINLYAFANLFVEKGKRI